MLIIIKRTRGGWGGGGLQSDTATWETIKHSKKLAPIAIISLELLAQGLLRV